MFSRILLIFLLALLLCIKNTIRRKTSLVSGKNDTQGDQSVLKIAVMFLMFFCFLFYTKAMIHKKNNKEKRHILAVMILLYTNIQIYKRRKESSF